MRQCNHDFFGGGIWEEKSFGKKFAQYQMITEEGLIIVLNHVLNCCSFQLVLLFLNNGNREILIFHVFFLCQMFVANIYCGYHYGCKQETFYILSSPDAFKMHFQSILVICWLSTLNVVKSEIGCKLFSQDDKGQGREDV